MPLIDYLYMEIAAGALMTVAFLSFFVGDFIVS